MGLVIMRIHSFVFFSIVAFLLKFKTGKQSREIFSFVVL